MPIEIRELIIKATVVPEGNATAGAAAGTSGDNDAAPGEAMIHTCIERILEILKEKNER